MTSFARAPLTRGPTCPAPRLRCATGGIENVYVFYWESFGNRGSDTHFKLEQYPRQVAVKMRGVQEVTALPTGMILYDMRAFELIEPVRRNRRDVLLDLKLGKIDVDEAQSQLDEGWFRYEWKDQRATEKASTEDVQNTRDISLAGMVKLGYNPIRCAWDSWIGHWKPWCVGKPDVFDVREVGAILRKATLEAHDHREVIADVTPGRPGLSLRPGRRRVTRRRDQGPSFPHVSAARTT